MTTAPPRIEDVLALTPLQEGLFALYRMAEDGVDVYTMQMRVDIEGPVDVDVLRASAAAMLVRHPNLRAAFWDRDVPKPVQIVPAHVELPWTERTATATEFDAIARSERRRPFDLGRGPALRIVVISEPGESRRRMIFTAHHIVMDGWSLAIYFTELLAVYRAGGTTDGLPEPRPYRDYIVWLGQQDTGAALATWSEYLGAVSGPLMLAEGAVADGDGVPDSTDVLMSEGDTARLRRWAGRHGLTLNTAVLFAWTVVLSRLTDRRDVVFGTVVSGRPERLAGVESMVGLFINSVPVVHHLGAATSVVEQCRRLQRETSTMRDIGYLSLSALQRAHGQGALFDTMFVFENAPIGDAIRTVTTPDGASFTPVEGESLTHYPLTVVAHASGDALTIVVETISAVLPHLSPAAVCERLHSVLRQLPDVGDRGPDGIDVLTAGERAGRDALPTQPAVPADATIWDAFERQVRATPSAVALTAAGQRFTYVELHAEACRLAVEFARYGVGPESIVALLMPRSTRSIVAILAVLAAGGAYVPVDTALPDARIASIVGQAGPVLVVTERALAHRVGDAWPVLALDEPDVVTRLAESSVTAPDVPRHSAQGAYVIFTSGSTGEPKGVVGTNAAVLGYLADHRARIYAPVTARLGRPLRIAHAWSLSFDASWQPMIGLLDGHSLHLFDADDMKDAQRLVAGMAAHGVDMIDTTPSMFVQLRGAGLLQRDLAVVALGGEAINAELWATLRALPDTLVVNCYGPTETTVEALVAPIGDHAASTIGTPNAGTAAYVLDSRLRIVPDGVIGELYLSGAQLARGYARRSAMTADRFVADPFRCGQRMYRTGDLVRRLPGGGHAYVGRADAQVKIRGYRVELGEIEAALRELPEVTDAAVSVVRRGGGASLVSFVVGCTGDPAALRGALADRLPAYMIPARVVALSGLPLNANAKLDVRALDALAERTLAGAVHDGATNASTATEVALCEVFAEQFGGVVPHLDDDFFALGLDSIVAISLVTAARRRGVAVSPRMMLTNTTIRSLAAFVDSAAATATESGEEDYGEVLPLPMTTWLCEYGNYRRFAHTVLVRLPAGIDGGVLEGLLQLLLDGHDTLRSTMLDTADGPRLVTREPGVVAAADVLTCVDLAGPSDDDLLAAIAEATPRALAEIDPATGAMVRAVWLRGHGRDVLLVVAHHLTVDPVSWHIMLGDLGEAWRAAGSGAQPAMLPEYTSYRRWSRLLWQRAASAEILAQTRYWSTQVSAPDPALGSRHHQPDRDRWSSINVAHAVLSAADTERILSALTKAEGVREFLLAAMTMTIASWRRECGREPGSGALIALEGHGRADAVVDVDTTNTVGSFITAYPVRLGVGLRVDVEHAERTPGTARALLDSVGEHLAGIPNEGLDYGLLRYITRVEELQKASEPQVQFSYLGRLDLGDAATTPWRMLAQPYLGALPLAPEPELPLRFAMLTSAMVAATPDGPQLMTMFRWSDALFTASDIDRFTELWQRCIAVLAAELAHGGAHGR